MGPADSDQLRQRISQVDGGELIYGRDYPYTILFPLEHPPVVIYTTKREATWQLLMLENGNLPVGMIAHYGLGRDEDMPRVAALAQGCRVYFLGDCDPFDLLVFAWLRMHMPVRYLGTSDAVLSAVGVDVNDRRITSSFSDEEQRAMPLVREVWPEFAEAVGPGCAGLLERNCRLELEALMSFRTNPASHLLELAVREEPPGRAGG
jgi:hypothetical protein